MLPTALQYVPKEGKLGRCKKRWLSNCIHGLRVIPELCVTCEFGIKRLIFCSSRLLPLILLSHLVTSYANISKF